MTERHQRIADRYSALISQPYEEQPTGIQNESRNIGELIFISLLEEYDQSIADKKGKPLAFGALVSKVQSKTPVEFPSNVDTAFGTVWKLGNDGSHARSTDATVQEAEAILNALYTCVDWYLYTHHKLSRNSINVSLPGVAREQRKNISDYREQVIAALADKQVSIDELNMLHRLRDNIPMDSIQTIHTEFGLEQGILDYLKSKFESKLQEVQSTRSILKRLSYDAIFNENELELLTHYITIEQVQELFNSTRVKLLSSTVPQKTSDDSQGQGATDMIFDGLVWLMSIALLEIGVGYFFNLPITDTLFFPISLELTLILIAIYHVDSHKGSTLSRKTFAYLLSGLWFLAGSSGIFLVYSWDDLRPHIEREVSASLSEERTYFYSLDGNVLEVNEHDLVEAIRLTPDAEHMVFNKQTEQWGKWDSYPNIVKAVKQTK